MILMYKLHLRDGDNDAHATLTLDWETNPGDAKHSMETVRDLYKAKGYDVLVEAFSWDDVRGEYNKVEANA